MGLLVGKRNSVFARRRSHRVACPNALKKSVDHHRRARAQLQSFGRGKAQSVRWANEKKIGQPPWVTATFRRFAKNALSFLPWESFRKKLSIRTGGSIHQERDDYSAWVKISTCVNRHVRRESPASKHGRDSRESLNRTLTRIDDC